MRIIAFRAVLMPALAIIGLALAACTQEVATGPGPASGPVQGHMLAARNYLNIANSELSQASHNKGGHRVNAMQLINQAISEVNAGMAYAANH